MKSCTRMSAALAAAILVGPGLALPASAETTPSGTASMRAYFGMGDTGETRQVYELPEYRVSRIDGGPIIHTVVNTEQVPITLLEEDNCAQQVLPPGGRAMCGPPREVRDLERRLTEDMKGPPAYLEELTYPCCIPALGELGEVPPRGGPFPTVVQPCDGAKT